MSGARRCYRVAHMAGRGVMTTALLTLSLPLAWAQDLSGPALVEAMARGGYVLVMRHAQSPQTPPRPQEADPENTTVERQLDAEGRQGAADMGRALRALRLPLSEVLTSPAFRARQTAALAELAARVAPELGDNGQSMQGATEAQASWLRERAARAGGASNVLLITHSPNIARAFPSLGVVADGEVIVFGPAGRVAGRIRIEDWPRLVPRN